MLGYFGPHAQVNLLPENTILTLSKSKFLTFEDDKFIVAQIM